jgi:hypothetical protein
VFVSFRYMRMHMHDAGPTRRRKCSRRNKPSYLFTERIEFIMHDYQRPPTLHRYGMRSDLELALSAGQFRLLPANGFLTLSFSAGLGQEPVRGAGPGRQLPDHPQLRRIRRTPAPRGAAHAAQLGRHRRRRSNTAPARRSALAFTQDGPDQAREKEWKFAWRSMSPQASLNPVTVRIGSIEQFAELRAPESYPV